MRKIVGQQVGADTDGLPKAPSHQNVQHRLRSHQNLNLFYFLLSCKSFQRVSMHISLNLDTGYAVLENGSGSSCYTKKKKHEVGGCKHMLNTLLRPISVTIS